MTLQPLDQNKILFRFENLGDEALENELDMKSICSALWLDANDEHLTNFNVQNLKLDIKEVNSIGLPILKKYNWKPYLKPSPGPWLPPFSMRSFSVDF